MECTTRQFSDDGLEVRGSNPAQSPLTASLDILLWLGIFLPHLRGIGINRSWISFFGIDFLTPPEDG